MPLEYFAANGGCFVIDDGGRWDDREIEEEEEKEEALGAKAGNR